MAFVKHSVNLFLVLLIVGSVGAIAGLTLYYQKSFQTVTGEYATINRNATACMDTLRTAQTELAAARNAVSANQQDVDKTVSLFEGKNRELNQTQNQLTQTQNRVKTLEGTVAQRDKSISDLNVQLGEKDKQLAALNKEIDSLEKKISNLEDDLDACQ